MVNVLASDDGRGGAGLDGPALDAGIPELGCLLAELRRDIVTLAVVVLTNLDGSDLVNVGLRDDLAGEDRLDGGVVVVLVDLLVDSLLDLLVAALLYRLMGDGRGHLLVHGRIVVPGFRTVKKRSAQWSRVFLAVRQ